MDANERLENDKSYNGFRTGLDLGMGVIYVGIGLFFICSKYFGITDLPGFAYVLGALMIAFGIFRVYRGLKALLQKKTLQRR